MPYTANLAIGDLVDGDRNKIKAIITADRGDGTGAYIVEPVAPPATQDEAQDIDLKYIVADTDPEEEGTNWLDSATVTAFPTDAQRNDLLRNDTGSQVTLDGTAIAVGAIYRFNGADWELWGSQGSAPVLSPYKYFKGSSTSGRSFAATGVDVVLTQATNRVLNGWEIQGNNAVCTEAHTADIEWSGTWSGGAQSGWVVARLYVTRGGTQTLANQSFSYFLERDGVGDKSGGQFNVGFYNAEFEVGDTFRIQLQCNNNFGATLHDWRLKVDEFVPSVSYVNAELVPVEDSEVVLIDTEGVNNTFYPFSTGETWAEIKANYTRLIVTGNVSQSGSGNIRPYSRVINLNSRFLEPYENSASGSDFQFDSSLNGVNVWAEDPRDTHTGFTYRQSSGDNPANGRMAFRVVAQKASKTATLVNPELVPTTERSRLNITYSSATTGTWGNGAVAPIGVNANTDIVGDRFSLDGNTIVVKAGTRVKLEAHTGYFSTGGGSNQHYFALEGSTSPYSGTGVINKRGFAISVQASGSNITNQNAVLEFTPQTDTRLQIYSLASNSNYQLNDRYGLITCEVVGLSEVVSPELVPVTDNFIRSGHLFSADDNDQSFVFDVPFDTSDGTVNADITVVLQRTNQDDLEFILAPKSITTTGFTVNRSNAIDGVGTTEPFSYVAINQNALAKSIIAPANTSEIDTGAISVAPLFDNTDTTDYSDYVAITMPEPLQDGDRIVYEYLYDHAFEGGCATVVARHNFHQRYIPWSSDHRIKFVWLDTQPDKVFFAAAGGNTTLRITRVTARRVAS